MKVLPQKYREPRTDWFAKRCQVVYRRANGLLEWQGFIHAIRMQDVLKKLKLQHGEIAKAYVRQDNADRYHSSCTILASAAIAESTGAQL